MSRIITLELRSKIEELEKRIKELEAMLEQEKNEADYYFKMAYGRDTTKEAEDE